MPFDQLDLASTTDPATPAHDAFDGRVAVIGGGQVAHHLVDELHSRGVTPVVLTRSGTRLDDADAGVVDANDTAALTRALDGASLVISTAQPAYHRWAEEFPALQQSIVHAAGTVGARLCVLDNLYGYGVVEGPLHEGLPLDATTRKGRVRARMTHDLFRAHERGEVRASVVRAADFFGPHARATAYGERLVEPLLRGKGGEILGDPDARHSVAFLPDLAQALVAVGASDAGLGRAWHAPHAPAVTQRELLERIATAARVEPKATVIARWQMRLAGLVMKPAREIVELWPEFTHDLVVDDTDIRRTFGLEHTPLDAAVAATVAWYRREQAR